MSDSSPPPATPLRPRDGDVVVAREPTSARYTIRQLPGLVQFSEPSRDKALRLARSFAQTHGVDLWYSEGRQDRLLARYQRDAGRPHDSPDRRSS